MSSVSVLRAVFFGTAETSYRTRIVRDDSTIHAVVPVTQAGVVPEECPKSPFYQVGLCAKVLDLRDEISPSNLSLIDIESVTEQGKPVDTENLDEAMDKLPERFFKALGKVNDEIENATGFNADANSALSKLLALRPGAAMSSSPKTKTGPITELDLVSLDLDVERLSSMGLTLAVINEQGITLDQIQAALKS